jgi:hypothetical protein
MGSKQIKSLQFFYSHLPILRILIRASGGISSGSSSSSKLNAAATVLDCDLTAPL